jgi:DNA invertase Pin-like site-specific DNA recombinase
MTAYGYIRKSRVHDIERTLSPETQEAAIRALAARHGDPDVTLLSDLDVSGKRRRNRRPGWDELLQAVEGGEAHAVYAYSLSRFARSVSQLAEFFDLCERQKVHVRVERDHIDTSTATGKLVGNVLASLAQFESDVASERVRDAFATKRASDPDWHGPGNLPYGSLPGEDLAAVLSAFDTARSFDGAARLLNQQRIPARGTSAVWHGSTVSGIMRRADPDRFAARGSGRGISAGAGSFRLSRLLVCSQCGTVMTPSRDARTGEPRYYCRGARVTPHGRGWVSEKVVLPAVAEEAQRAALLVRRLTVGSAHDQEKAAALEAKRARIIDMAADGMLDKADAQRRLAEVAEAERALSTRRTIRRITIAPDVVADDPQRVNQYLRRLLDRVVVDMTTPARRGPAKAPPRLNFEWQVPELRAG